MATSSRRTSSSPCRHTPRRQPQPPSTRSSSRTSRPALRSATRSKAATSPVSVSGEPAPTLDVPASGIRLAAQGGGLSGYEARIVNAQVGDTLVSLTFLKATEDQRQTLTKAAVAKVTKAFGTTAS